MEKTNQETTGIQLSKLSKTSIPGSVILPDKLLYCIKLNIPIFIKAPSNTSLWAVDSKFEDLKNEDDYSSGDSLDFADPTKLEKVKFLRLLEENIKELVIYEDVTVDEFTSYVDFDGAIYKEKKSVVALKFQFEERKPELNNVYSMLMNIRREYDNLRFILVHKSNHYKNGFKFPLGSEYALDINIKDLFVAKEYLKADASISDISKQNEFYLGDEYRSATNFFNLSQLGATFKGEGNQAMYISSYAPKNRKLRTTWKSAAGKLLKDNGENFKIAKQIYDEFWLKKPKLKGTDLSANINFVIAKITEEMKVAESYANQIELIIRPDIYSKKSV